MKALILVDLQNDFAPGGALAVPEGDKVVAVANKVMPSFDLVVATQDWHPADHGSFASRHPGKRPGEVIDLDGRPQVLWPDHCVQGTRGAELIPGLNTTLIDRIVHKGTDRAIDSYSGFFDNGGRKSTGLADLLAKKDVDELYVLGLATDYCVKATVLDALRLGLRVRVVSEGVRGVDLQPGDSRRALDEMKAAGATIVSMKKLA
jgi:nicotinamidase/pyrazinamidase